MKLIKIVTAVERTPITNLQGMTRISSTEVRLPSDIEWMPLVIKPHAQLTINDKLEDKNVVWTAKLVFKTCSSLPDHDRWAYRCRLSDGQYRLIGSGERPYPTVSVNESMPENVADNQLNEVTVNWQTPSFVPFIKE